MIVVQADIYDHIINNIEPLCIAVLFVVVAAGWFARLALHLSYAPPRAAKITAGVTFAMFAYYYLAIEFQFMEHDHRRALLRMIMMMLIMHELIHHVYVGWLYGKLKDGGNGKSN